MAAHGWNSAFTNVNSFRRDNSRPYGSSRSPTILACRRCDKICLGALSLLDHYESHHSHEAELAHQRQNQHRTNFWAYQRERNNPFHHRVAPSTSSFFRQRPHPYFPNGYQPNSSFLVPTQNQQFFQACNHPVTSDNNLTASGRQSVVNRPTGILESQVGLSMRNEDQKGYDEFADKRTIWYLGQLEKPIPKIIDLKICHLHIGLHAISFMASRRFLGGVSSQTNTPLRWFPAKFDAE